MAVHVLGRRTDHSFVSATLLVGGLVVAVLIGAGAGDAYRQIVVTGGLATLAWIASFDSRTHRAPIALCIPRPPCSQLRHLR